MRKRHKAGPAARLVDSAPLFAVLADRTRLSLILRLSEDGPASIVRLTLGSGISRQAVTKHLRVMQHSGLVRSERHGRETLWQLDQRRLRGIRRYLALISKQWDDALARLQSLVER